MDVSGDHPLSGALGHWESMLEDMAVTAEEYREDGWAVLELDPGAVTVDTELPGFDVLVPDNQFREASDLLEGGVDSYQVFLGFGGGVVFALVALEDTTAEHVVLAPLYYRQANLDELQAVAAGGGLSTRLRTLDRTAFVVDHEDASLFFPTEE